MITLGCMKRENEKSLRRNEKAYWSTMDSLII